LLSQLKVNSPTSCRVGFGGISAIAGAIVAIAITPAIIVLFITSSQARNQHTTADEIASASDAIVASSLPVVGFPRRTRTAR
jgi:hypothetical protein